MIPEFALDAVKRFEGFHKQITWKPVALCKPYLCPAGYWTIGYGHLCSRGTKPITKEEATDLLIIDFSKAWIGALRQCPNLSRQSIYRQMAIADFVFNLGEGRLRASTLRKRILANRWESAPAELKKWVWGGGRKLPGLIARREVEILWWNTM